jgi:hypothetical protein
MNIERRRCVDSSKSKATFRNPWIAYEQPRIRPSLMNSWPSAGRKPCKPNGRADRPAISAGRFILANGASLIVDCTEPACTEAQRADASEQFHPTPRQVLDGRRDCTGQLIEACWILLPHCWSQHQTEPAAQPRLYFLQPRPELTLSRALSVCSSHSLLAPSCSSETSHGSHRKLNAAP